MDNKENKIIELKKAIEEKKGNNTNTIRTSFLHTNPLLERMFISNLLNKKKKFSLKDIFR